MSVNGHGKVPTAHQRARTAERETGQAENSLAQVIGQAVALHLAQVLGQLLPQMPWHPACIFCVALHKQAGAAQSADGPQAALPPIGQAVTWMPVTTQPGQPPVASPVCYAHFQTGPAARPVGLVMPDGTPIIAQAG